MLVRLQSSSSATRCVGLRRTKPFCAASSATKQRPAAGRAKHIVNQQTQATSHSIAIDRLAFSSIGLFLLNELPALAQSDYEPSFDSKSYWVTLGLFALTAPGLWSLIKRAPRAKIARKTYEVEGPAVPTAVPIDDRARSISRYFKKYNYEIKGTGEVITFVGTYAPDKGQAAALVFYTFCSLASIALVLSITVPAVGSWWYLMTAISPAAGFYYWQRATRQEEVQIKMVTSDDDLLTDIVVQGDTEELERLAKELDLVEKGKIRVKGLLENAA